MSKIKTFKGQIAIDTQEKLNLSTNDGLTGYKIRKFQIISKTPGTNNIELIGQVFLTDQTGVIGTNVDFDNPDLVGVAFHVTQYGPQTDIIFDQETFNQDIFVTMTDASGNTVPGNYYLELEQFKMNLNESTYNTLKNIRSRKRRA
jgi:hypothetical protein